MREVCEVCYKVCDKSCNVKIPMRFAVRCVRCAVRCVRFAMRCVLKVVMYDV